ncbi:MAG: NAD(P)-dependent oxidoreductase [Alphaproteobacteria bacterium]
MNGKKRVGYIGVGLMGHGAAKNILEKGKYPLTIMGHRNREPVDDLVKRGAVEVTTPAAVAGASDIVFLSVPSSVEVEQLVYDPNGILAGGHEGLILVDQTTGDPSVTRKIAADLAQRGMAMVDAPHGRSPAQAEEGRLAAFLGGDPDVISEITPVVECFADTIITTGPVGSALTAKLINNLITVGNAALLAEALATAAALDVDMPTLYKIMSSTAANSNMLHLMMPWVLEGDDSKLKGPIRLGAKDLSYYTKLAETAPSVAIAAQAVSQVMQLAVMRGYKDRYLPVLPGVLAELGGTEIQPLE